MCVCGEVGGVGRAHVGLLLVNLFSSCCRCLLGTAPSSASMKVNVLKCVSGCVHVSKGANKLLFCLSSQSVNLTCTHRHMLMPTYKCRPKLDMLAAFHPDSEEEAVCKSILIVHLVYLL